MSASPCILHYRRYRLPFRAPLRTAHGWWREREGLWVRVEDGTGRVGWGEIAPIPWFGTETLAEAEAACAALGGRVDPGIGERLPERLGCVRFGLAAALAQVAVGSRPDGPAAARLPVAALLPAGREARRVLADRLAAGHLAFKWKVGVGRPEDEWGLFDDLLGELPGYARLRLDANGGWDRRTAAKWLERCAERRVEFVEQPVAPGDEDALLGLARDYPVTLALDESVVRLAEARRWQGRGWPGVFVIKPALCGPLPEIAAWVEETGADIVVSSAVETAVGRAALVPWAVGRGVTKRALGFGLGEIFADPRANGPFLGAVADAGWGREVTGEALWESGETAG